MSVFVFVILRLGGVGHRLRELRGLRLVVVFCCVSEGFAVGYFSSDACPAVCDRDDVAQVGVLRGRTCDAGFHSACLSGHRVRYVGSAECGGASVACGATSRPP